MLKLLSPALRMGAAPENSGDATTPEVRQGKMAAINALTEDVVELVIEPASPLPVLPGQHMQLEFAGFPRRSYTPTPALDARADDGMLRFHVTRLANGRVSSELGRAIAVGHRVKLSGPHGAVCLPAGLQNRLVLVSSGTGFAPMWAIADAALRERPSRSMLLVVGVKAVQDLYMVQALDLMAACPNVRILVTSEEKQSLTRYILVGRPTDYVPLLLPRDTVFAAGPAPMVASVEQTAAASGAVFHAVPFVPANDSADGTWISRVLWRRGKATPVVAPTPDAAPAAENLTSRLRDVAASGPPPLKINPAPTLR